MSVHGNTDVARIDARQLFAKPKRLAMLGEVEFLLLFLFCFMRSTFSEGAFFSEEDCHTQMVFMLQTIFFLFPTLLSLFPQLLSWGALRLGFLRVRVPVSFFL